MNPTEAGIQFVQVCLQRLFCPAEALINNTFDFLIDYQRRLIAVIALLYYIPAQEYLFLPLAESSQAQAELGLLACIL